MLFWGGVYETFYPLNTRYLGNQERMVHNGQTYLLISEDAVNEKIE